MNLIYVLDYRFARTPDGVIWTDTAYDCNFWEPHLQIFDAVTLVSRVREVAAKGANWLPVSSDRVAIEALPHYLGPVEFLKNSGRIRARMREIFDAPGAVILRVPSQLSSMAAAEMKRLGKGYAVEVVGDPSAALARGVVKVTGRPLFRYWFTRSQERICRDAIAAAYVAKPILARYPVGRNKGSLVCSDVRLDEAWMVPNARQYKNPGRHIVTVATLSQTYKGIDVLLKAVAECRAKGHPLRLTVIGHGKFQPSLEKLAADLMIENSVQFAGCVPWGPSLIRRLDDADLFVLPSRVEVLPRALLEAMSRSLPAIATNVGAVSDLLPPAQLVKPGSVAELAERMIWACNSPARLTVMSHKSLETARCYAWPQLRPRWVEFYGQLAAGSPDATSRTVKPRLVLLTTSAGALWTFFRDQAKFLRQSGFEVYAICGVQGLPACHEPLHFPGP
jgi:glycosyltransferase involved in cell wall biosynthesis